MKHVILVFISFFVVTNSCVSQNQSFQYYNDQWKPCKKNEALYYRIIEPNKKVDKLFAVSDYYISGKPQWQGHLSSISPDINEGWCTWYFENGRLAQKGLYEKGILKGDFVAYSKNGHIKAKTPYKKGLIDGQSITYYPNGKAIKTIFTYKKGKQEGAEIEFYTNGNIRVKQYYKNDTLEGKRIYYHENGQIESTVNFTNGFLEGDEFIYYKNGQLNLLKTYKNGLLVGEAIGYYKNKVVKNRDFYKEGLKDGNQIYYDTSGQIQSIYYYRMDTLIKAESFNKKGLKNRESIYFNQFHFKSKYWDDNGNLSEETVYKNGDVYSKIRYGPNGITYKKIREDTLRLYPAKDNKLCLYGLKNYQKQWVVNPQYTFCQYYGQYYIVSLNEKYGVLNSEGKEIIPVKYDKIEGAVSHGSLGSSYISGIGIFKVLKDTLWGIINSQNKLILPINYNEPRNLENNRIVIKQGALYGFVDTFGNVYEPLFKELSDFNEWGYATFSDQKYQKNVLPKQGAVNSKGEIIVPAIYEYLSNNSYGGNFNFIWAGNKKKYGLYNLAGNKILDTLFTKYEKVIFYDYNLPEFSRKDSLCSLYANGKYGVINSVGKIILPFEYDTIKWINPDYRYANSKVIAFIKKGNQWAAINKKCEIITPWYDEMEAIIEYVGNEDDYAYSIHFLVKRNHKYGIVNETDSVLVPFKYENAYINKQYKAVFLIKNQTVSVYKNQKLVKTNEFVNALDEEDEIFIFGTNDENYNNRYQYGVVNYFGKILLNPNYSVNIYGGQYIVYSDAKGQSGILNRKGEVVLANDGYQSIEGIKGDFVTVIKLSGKVGILDLVNKRFIVDTVFDAITNFDKPYGLCWVKPDLAKIDTSWFRDDQYNFRKGGWGLIDINRKYILPPEYDFPMVFNDSFGLVYKNDLMGVVSINGKWLLPCIYQDIREQKNGLYFIKNVKWGIADKQGKILIEPSFDEMGDLIGGQAPFWIDGNIGLVDSTGKITVASQKDGFAKTKFPIENLFNYYSDRYKDLEILIEGIGYQKVSILELIGNNELVSEYFESNSNDSLQTAMNNFLISRLLKNHAFGNTWYDGTNNRNETANYIYSEAYKRLSYFFNDRETQKNFTVEVLGISKKIIFCMEKVEEHSDRYYSIPDVELNNYYLTSNNNMIKIELKNLFDSNQNYKHILNQLLFKKAMALQDVNLPCYDMDKYFETVEQSFSITDTGIVFYLDLNNGASNFNIEDSVFLSVSFSELYGIIDKKGILKEYFK